MRGRIVIACEALALLLLGLMVLGFAARGQLLFFINLKYQELVVAGAAGLVVLAVLHAIPALERRGKSAHGDAHGPGDAHGHDHGAADDDGREDGHEHATGTGSRLRMAAWLLLPVALAAVFQPRPLSSATAAARGIANDLANGSAQPKAFTRREAWTLYDWVTALNLDPEPDHYRGDVLNVEGFTMRDPADPAGTFVVAKFVISCCAADARPVGLRVRVPEGEALPHEGVWLRVQGHVVESRYLSDRYALVQAEHVTPIPEPANPYIN